jgi:beta-glucanase (GH16 family)
MRRGFLILIGLLLSAVFSLYVLDVRTGGDIIYPDPSPEVQAGSGYIKVSGAKASPDHFRNGRLCFDNEAASNVDFDELELVWADEFDQPTLNMEIWTKMDRRDNYNHELQYYVPAAGTVENGCLVLTADRQTLDGKAFTSAMVHTENKLCFRYGRIEARMRVPAGKGLFPAFWLLSDSGKSEIDIMEMIGSEPNTFYGVIHYYRGDRQTKEYRSVTNRTPQSFHVYALEWDQNELRWYLDGKLYFRTGNGVPHEDLHILFTLAVGGTWPGSPDETTDFPCSLMIDYVRLYRQK